MKLYVGTTMAVSGMYQTRAQFAVICLRKCKSILTTAASNLLVPN